jgi:hypothetical protein
VAGRVAAEVADLARDPDPADAVFQQGTESGDQVRDGEDVPRRLARVPDGVYGALAVCGGAGAAARSRSK